MAIKSSLTQEIDQKKMEKENPKLDFTSPDSSLTQGDSDSESTSVSSSMQDSISSATSTVDQHSSNVKQEARKKKPLNRSISKKLATFGSFMASRRRAQSKLSQSSINLSDDGSATPSQSSSIEISDESPNYVQKPMPKFKRTGSLRTVKIFRTNSKNNKNNRNKTKSNSKLNPSSTNNYSQISQESHLKKATFSSILKDSKFPEQLKHQSNPSEPEELLPVAKICSYHHCSLHGNHHHHQEHPQKPFPYLKKRTPKDRIIVRPESQTKYKASSKRRQVKGTRMAANEDDSIEFYAKSRSEPVSGIDHGDAELADVLFGVNTLKEHNPSSKNRVFDEVNDELGEKDEEISVGLKKTWKKDVIPGSKNREFDEENNELGEKDEEISDGLKKSWKKDVIPGSKNREFDEGKDELGRKDEEISDGLKKSWKKDVIPGSKNREFDEVNDELGGKDEEISDGLMKSWKKDEIPGSKNREFGEVNEELGEKDEEISNGLKKSWKEKKHISMWRMIHENMVSGLAAEVQDDQSEKKLKDEKKSDDDGNQETEIRKMFAIKLVRDAIEKILLPEVQDDQSTTSEVVSERDLAEVQDDQSSASDRKTEKTEKGALKRWSNLKKVILLNKFVKELEKVKKFNPKRPRGLPLPASSELVTVSLRRQVAGEKRNSDEWMLDYALQKVVSELGPTQKRKVALLVKAFETVAPGQDDSDSNSFESKSNDKIEEVSESISESKPELEKENHIKMWHMIYQHVVTDIATRIGSDLLLDGEESTSSEEKNLQEVENQENQENRTERNYRLQFTQSDAVKLVRESVDEILLPNNQEPEQKVSEPEVEKSEKLQKQTSKNWAKLKKLIMLKRSIKALEGFRKPKSEIPQEETAKNEAKEERIGLRNQMMNEKKKAEQWMLDYAVQHIVSKLTPARKKRVSMLVEAFEAVVPFPET